MPGFFSQLGGVTSSPRIETKSARYPRRLEEVCGHDLHTYHCQRPPDGGVPCIRGLRIPVATVVAMMADGMATDEILRAYPDLRPEDIREALKVCCGGRSGA